MHVRHGVWLVVIAVLAGSLSFGDEPTLAIRKLLQDGNVAEAESAARRRLADLDAHDPAGTLETASVLDLLATALDAQAAGVPRVREVVDRAVAIKTRISGADHFSIAVSLLNLGKQQSASGDYSGGVATLERAAALQKDPATPRLEQVQVLDALGSVLTETGQYARSQQTLERALALAEADSGPDTRIQAEVLRHLGANGWQSGDMPTARRYLERAVAIFERTLGPDHISTGNAVGDLASVVKLTGNYAEAKPLFERSLRIYELRLGPDHPRLAVPLNNLALCVKELDEFEAARDLLQRALSILEKKLGADNPRTATVLQNLGIVYNEMGDFTQARLAYERALGIQERRLGADHPLVASVCNSLGELLNELGDIAAAKPYLARALAIYQAKTAADNPKIPEVMQSLAGVLRESGDRAGARDLIERSIRTYEQALGKENAKLVDPLVSLGELQLEAGDKAGAEAQYTRALEIQQKAVGTDHRRTAAALDHLAALRGVEKNYAEEARLEQEAIRTFAKAVGERSYYAAEPLARLAQALGHLERQDEALRAALESAAIRRQHLRVTMRVLPERQALLFAAGGNPGLDAALSLVARQRGASAQDQRKVWDELIRGRGLVLDEMAGRHRAVFSAVGSGAIPPLAQELRTARERLARLVVSGPDGKAASTYRARWERARAEVDRAERALAGQVSDYRRELDSERAGYTEMAAALPASGALVAFARYRDEGADEYLAFVLKAGDSAPSLVRLGPAAPLEARVSAWRREIQREAGAMGRNARFNEQEYRKAGLALRRAIWDPLETHLRGAATVYIVPDAALQLVNLTTLPWGASGYLAESGRLLHTLSAERDLTDPPYNRLTTGLLALGNPSFQTAHSTSPAAGRGVAHFRGAHSGCADFASLRFDPLPASEAEVRAILAIWKQGGESSLVLRGSEATEADFKNNAPGKRVLHLATHGFFLKQECRGAGAGGENPLLHAGLALAGANQRRTAATDADDGILTAEEVASLNLQGAEWVVLSGCDTGSGEVRAGEGVLGLRRAFRIAGAATLIASLWPVEDEATRQWMTTLYQARFERKKSTAQSVADATLRQLRARRAKGLSTHPFYWGSFVAVGDWR
jgi:CHAT domain-containing protein/Tfp pilus assembly protein PilF